MLTSTVEPTPDGASRVRSLARAEVALAEGRHHAAIEIAGGIIDRPGAPVAAEHVRALAVVARARLERGDDEAAAAAASQGIALADAMRFDALGWRLEMVHAIATGAPTDDAAARFRALATRIAEPELRAAFEHQALAPG